MTIRCCYSGKERPKLIARVGLGSNIFICEKGELWETMLLDSTLVWCFYAYYAQEPVDYEREVDFKFRKYLKRNIDDIFGLIPQEDKEMLASLKMKNMQKQMNEENDRVMAKIDSKYYQPQIEEFHHRFECEENIGGEWTEIRFDNHHGRCDLGEFMEDFRVKHLDRSDIEGEGFQHQGGTQYALEVPRGTFMNEYTSTVRLHHYDAKHEISIEVRTIGMLEGEWTRFKCPNVSIFRQILKLIGVK